MFDARILRGANAGRSPALRDAALAGTLNRVVCPACGRASIVDEPLVYADPQRGQWISVAPRRELSRWAEIERTAMHAFGTAVGAAAIASSARRRVVFDVDELRERLAIWDAGLDDALVECVKLRCLRDRPAIRESGERIRLVAIADALTLAMLVGGDPARRRAEIRVERGALDEIAADPAWRGRFSELFEPGFVSIDRYLIP